jgi:hypothetical protein
MTPSSKSLQWGKNQHKVIEELKRKISQTPMLVLPKLQKPFEVERNESGYAMGEVMMKVG